MIFSLGYDRFRVVTATWGFFPLFGFFLFCVFVRSLLYLVRATSRELPVSYIEHPHRYHHIPEPPPACFSPCFAPLPLPTLPQLSLGCERAAIRVSLSPTNVTLVVHYCFTHLPSGRVRYPRSWIITLGGAETPSITAMRNT